MKSPILPELKALRTKIDCLDRKIIEQVSRRLAIARRIGMLKKRHSLRVLDARRERALAARHLAWSVRYGIQPQTVQKIFKLILKEARKRQ